MYSVGIFNMVFRALFLSVVCAVVAVYAQQTTDDNRFIVSDVVLKAGSRGLILIINGSGPIKVETPPGLAAKYPELRVKINNARSGLEQKSFIPPESLPVKELTLENLADGVQLIAKMRGNINGPVDIRSGGSQVRILLTKDAQPELEWSSGKGIILGKGEKVGKADATVKPEPVDTKRAEERATKETQPPVGGGNNTVAVKKEPPQTVASSTPAPTSPAPPAAAPPAPRAQNRQQTVQQSALPPSAPQIAKKSEVPAAIEEDIRPDGEVTKKTPEGELVRYKVFGRDPFVPLVKDTTTTDLPRVENLRLVGVLEDSRERIALVEDFKNGGRAFALRTNDPIDGGKVLRVDRGKVVFLIRDFDVSRSYILGLAKQ